jgi:hypothetical protein
MAKSISVKGGAAKQSGKKAGAVRADSRAAGKAGLRGSSKMSAAMSLSGGGGGSRG